MAKFIVDTDKGTCVPYDNYSSYSDGYEQGRVDMKQEIISKTNWLDNSYRKRYNEMIDEFIQKFKISLAKGEIKDSVLSKFDEETIMNCILYIAERIKDK